MIGAFSALGFTAPYLLASIPLGAAILVYAYRKRGVGRRQVVASLLILRRLQTTLSARQKFVPPVRFFIELLAVLLLGLAAAGVHREAPQERIALVVDNSLGMAARVGNESRFAAALQDLRTFLESAPDRTRVGLYITSPVLTQRGAGLLTPSQALKEVEAVQVAYGADALQSALTKVTQEVEYDRVVAWSDKTLEAPHARLQVRAPGVARGSNIAVQNIAVERRADRGVMVVFDIAAFTTREATVAVHLTGFREVAGSLSGVKLAEQQVSIPASRSIRVEFPVETRSMAAFSVRIEPTSRATDESFDVLQEDNIGFVTAAEGGNRLTVVTTDLQAAQSLGVVPAITVSVSTPEQYAAQPVVTGVALFHRTVPPALPAVNSLFVLPPPGSQLGGALVQGSPILITRWKEGHPLLRYLTIPVITLKSLVPLRRPAWAEEIITSTDGTVAFAGEYAGHRYVALGFDLLPFGGRRDPLSSVLLLNILKWLSGATLSSGYELVPHRIPAAEKPGGSTVQDVRYVVAATPQGIEDVGGDRIAPVPGLITLGAAGKRTVRALDFFSDEESNTLSLHTVDVPASPTTSAVAQRGVESLADFLVVVVLGVLAAEGVWALMRARTASRAGGRI